MEETGGRPPLDVADPAAAAELSEVPKTRGREGRAVMANSNTCDLFVHTKPNTCQPHQPLYYSATAYKWPHNLNELQNAVLPSQHVLSTLPDRGSNGLSVLCLDRSPIAHNLVLCTWTSGQVDAAACLRVVGSQTVFPALLAIKHKSYKGGVRAVSFDYSPALFKI